MLFARKQIAFLFIVLLLVSAVSSAEYKKRSLSRSEDYVLFYGKDAQNLFGAELSDLHLYKCGASGMRAVPFQVDKRDSEGRLIFPDDARLDPLRDGTRLDSNDEMVFMIKDAGDKCAETAWVDGAARGVEIELSDPRDGGKAWVYLFEMPGAEPPEVEDYVSQYEDDERVYARTEFYEVGQPHGKQYYDWLKLRRPDGSWGEDLFDRQKMGMKALLLNGSLPLAIPEQAIKPVTLGVIDGPVRVVRNEMRLTEIKLVGFEYVTEFYNYFYANGYVSPLDIDVPVTMYKLFLDISFYYGMDFSDAAVGSVVTYPSNPGGIKLDGVPDRGIDDDSDNLYMVFKGSQGSFIEVFYLDEQLAQVLDRTAYIDEDPGKTDPGDEFPGRLIAGFDTKSAKNLQKGKYYYALYHYYPYPFTDTKADQVLAMIEDPVRVKVKPLPSPGAL